MLFVSFSHWIFLHFPFHFIWIYTKVYLQHFGLIVYHLKTHKYNYKYVLWMWPYFYLYIYVIMEENLLWYEHFGIGWLFHDENKEKKNPNKWKKRVFIGETQGSWRLKGLYNIGLDMKMFFFRSFIYFTSSLCYVILISLATLLYPLYANKIAWPTPQFLWPFSDG